MIQANELRIGNIVKCKVSNDAGLYRVIALDGYNLKIMLDGARFKTWYTEDKIKPIPLTHEILEKAGMSKWNETDNYWMNGGCDYIVDENYNFYLFCEADGNKWYVKKLKSLHDFQNTVYILTGEELNIQL